MPARRGQPNTGACRGSRPPTPKRHWKAAGQPTTTSPRALRPARPGTARLELVPAGPIDVKPDPWQRLVAIGSILSVLFVAIGLFITNNANREQQRLTAQGQITDRFTKAIEQLGQTGPDKVDIRLGAIYALERIMRDSAEDQPAVVDILAAFVRVHAPASPRPTSTPASTSPKAVAPPRPPVDIQAALTVLFRRDTTRSSPGTVDLTDTNLVGAHLYGANLSGTIMNGAVLRNANLIKANMSGVDLNGADLRDASVWEIDLSGTWMLGTDLRGTVLLDANLSRAILRDADLSGVYLVGTDLTGTDLTGARMDDTNPTGPSPLPRCAHTDQHTQLPEGVARPSPCPRDR